MKIKRSKLKELAIQFEGNDSLESQNKILIKIATARCARLSYMTFDGEIDYNKDIELHHRLLQSGHMSPMEHCARAMDEDELTQFQHVYPRSFDGVGSKFFVDTEDGWCNNFRGWIQYRYLIENKG